MTNQHIEIYLQSKAWPFEEAKRIYQKINGKIPAKGYVLFETGYGPSGLPHIGTFGEVVRTVFVRHAFSLIAPHIPTKMFCVSDDIDGLRKVPDNIPNQDLIKQHLGKPLTSIPDPFGTHKSYGDHMNARLKNFLDSFGFEYEFISATQKYQSGEYDQALLRVLEKYQEIMNLMLPTLGNERQETYCPFMPIDPETGIVIDKGVKSVDQKNATIRYLDSNGKEKEISILKGGCKLQWKIDFATRWYFLNVDYEIYGKDHQPNEKIYRTACEILGGVPPVNYTYEMFLSETGEKISKSKGNGISVEQWLRYAPDQSLALFMYQKPKTAKRLYFDVIPKAMDEYLTFAQNFNQQDQASKVENPVFFIDYKNPDHNQINFNLSYSLLLNLACACNPENQDVIWGFISKYQPGLNKNSSPILAQMVEKVINYYNDFIKKNKNYRSPNDNEIHALQALSKSLKNFNNQLIDANEVQNLVYQIGKEFGYEKNMRDWFLALYQILLGQDQGPRIGSFIALFGIDNFNQLIDQSISKK
jgi:lysyl-tRNA synthetase class 1